MRWMSWDKLSFTKNEGGIGFRDLESFNVALLAKQVWRLMQHPNSLVAKVLRGRYFAHGSILDGTLGSKPSYLWTSLMEGCQLIRKGMRIVIGDGKETKVWQDAWLPVYPPRSLIGSPGIVTNNSTVLMLIHEGTSVWNTNLIEELFILEDANIIKGIKLSSKKEMDLMGWHYTYSGL